MICFCDDAGGADVLATAPGRSPGLAPTLVEALSVLLSCVHFLALYCVVHYFSSVSISEYEGAELPLTSGATCLHKGYRCR